MERLAADADVTEVDLPASFDGLVAAQTTIMEREATVALAAEWRDHAGQLSDELVAVLERGRATPEAAYQQAQQLARECRDQLREVFAGLDFLLAASAVGEAPVGLGRTGDPVFARMWTLLGVPTVSVPGLTGPAGMPLGVQVIAAPGADARAVEASGWLARRLR